MTVSLGFKSFPPNFVRYKDGGGIKLEEKRGRGAHYLDFYQPQSSTIKLSGSCDMDLPLDLWDTGYDLTTLILPAKVPDTSFNI